MFAASQGKPKPVVTWTKNGQPVDSKRVNVRSTGHDSILFIRQSEREDSGVYEMSVKVDDFEDKSSLILQIVGNYYNDGDDNDKTVRIILGCCPIVLCCVVLCCVVI